MKSELTLLEKRIEDVVEAVKAVRAKIDEALPGPAKRWRANEEENYWCVNESGTAVKYTDSGHTIDNFNYSKGNYFKSEREAEQYLKNLKTKQKLNDLALKLNNGKEIDWQDSDQFKYFILYDNKRDKLVQEYNIWMTGSGTAYCLDRNFLETALTVIYEDDLINLIKSGV